MFDKIQTTAITVNHASSQIRFPSFRRALFGAKPVSKRSKKVYINKWSQCYLWNIMIAIGEQRRDARLAEEYKDWRGKYGAFENAGILDKLNVMVCRPPCWSVKKLQKTDRASECDSAVQYSSGWHWHQVHVSIHAGIRQTEFFSPLVVKSGLVERIGVILIRLHHLQHQKQKEGAFWEHFL